MTISAVEKDALLRSSMSAFLSIDYFLRIIGKRMVDADKANESSTNARKLDTGKEKYFKHIVFCFLLFFFS